MSQQKGRLLLIKIGNGGSPETFANLCGLNTRSFNLSANEIETTVPNCDNPGDAVQRTVEPGIVQRTFTGSGKFLSGGTQATLLAHVRAATVFNAQVLVPDEGTYEGAWMVSDFEFSGEMEGTMEFSATFSAAGPLTFTPEAAPVNTLLPSISGIAEEGQTLTANVGQWTGAGIVYTYQWNADGSPIGGATGASYLVANGDVGDPITVTVTATNGSGSASATSAPTVDVVADT